MGTDNSGGTEKNTNLQPLNFPEDYNPDQSEQKIKSLFEDNKLQSLINESKSAAVISIRWGIFIIVVAFITLIALAFITKRDSDTNAIATECACCNGKITCFNGCCSTYDLSIYGFMFVAIIGLGIGVILIRHYVAASKKATDLNDHHLTIRELQVAWEMAKGLADWIENEPETKVEEKKSAQIKSKEEDTSKPNLADEKITTKGKGYSFPRQRAQQQIIETLLSRNSK